MSIKATEVVDAILDKCDPQEELEVIILKKQPGRPVVALVIDDPKTARDMRKLLDMFGPMRKLSDPADRPTTVDLPEEEREKILDDWKKKYPALAGNVGRTPDAKKAAKKRLEYIRGEIAEERISYEEIAELQSLAEFIEPGDVELLEWAGVEEDTSAGMTLEEIKQALEDGKRVFWLNESYEVIKDCIGQYLIKCHLNDSCIGLTWLDGTTVNGKPEEFYVGPAER